MISESAVCSLHGVCVEFLHHPLVQRSVEYCLVGIRCQLLSILYTIQWIYWQTECQVSYLCMYVHVCVCVHVCEFMLDLNHRNYVLKFLPF